MQDKLEQLKKKVLEESKDIVDLKQLEDFKNKYLGRKGELAKILKGLKDVAADLRPQVGALANKVKNELEDLLNKKLQELSGKLQTANYKLPTIIDVTEPGIKPASGHLNPITQIQYEIEEFFRSMGFMVSDGPEIETDFYNFEALNMPADHPARDMQDTFYTENGNVLRTHTSPVQIRAMKKFGAPIRVIVPGRCFRNEATDARHEHTLYQLEGLMIDKDISIANLMAVLEAFAKFLYGQETKMRMRPKFYPFVEPGVNVEVTCLLCKGKGCRVCKKSGWMEIAGAGMVHPHVLKAGNIDSQKYSGFAFGFGLSRIAMLKYGIEDTRLFLSGDLRFVRQF